MRSTTNIHITLPYKINPGEKFNDLSPLLQTTFLALVKTNRVKTCRRQSASNGAIRGRLRRGPLTNRGPDSVLAYDAAGIAGTYISYWLELPWPIPIFWTLRRTSIIRVCYDTAAAPGTRSTRIVVPYNSTIVNSLREKATDASIRCCRIVSINDVSPLARRRGGGAGETPGLHSITQHSTVRRSSILYSILAQPHTHVNNHSIRRKLRIRAELIVFTGLSPGG